MKRVLFIFGLVSLLAFTAQAQTARLGKVTKITATSATVAGASVATIAFDDTTAGNYIRRNAVPFRRSNVLLDFSGTGVGSVMTVRDISGQLIYRGALSTIRVVGATSQTDSLKVVYLKVNGY